MVENVFEEAIATARREIWKDIGAGKAGSATAAITDKGKIVYAEGFGMADRENGCPVERDTRFNIGSITKIFTAMAIMLLVDDGKLELEAPVVQYLPQFVMADPRYKEITLRMILNHTSGLPGITAANNFGFEYNAEVFKQTLENLSRSNLKHVPGAMAVYCNDGFTLAEMIIERISGQKFVNFLSRRILLPLSLVNTGLSVGELSGTAIARYYQPVTGKKEPPEAISLLGAGGFSSTAHDLCLFADTFSGSGVQILSKSALDEMKRAQPPLSSGKFRNPVEFSFGLGWDMTCFPIYQEKGIKLLGKRGETCHYSSFLVTLPDERISVAVIESGPQSSASQTALNVLRALLGRRGLLENRIDYISKPRQHQEIPQQYSAFEGYYAPLMKIAFDLKENIVRIMAIEDGTEKQTSSLYYNDGYFYDAGGLRSYFTSFHNEDFYVSVSDLNTDIIKAQKLKIIDKPLSLKIDVNGKLWLMRNARPFDGVLLVTATHLVKSSTIELLPGYVNFAGIKKIISPESAGMPVSALADQTELTLFEKDGHIWARLSEMLYSPEDVAVPLETGNKTVTIGPDGYNEWLVAEQDLILGFEKPAKGRVIVFDPNNLVIYDSAVDLGETLVRSGCLVELSAYAGESFQVITK
ncbi:MAG: penicillin binding protein-like protein [Chloroflexi bacterium]|nr:penicillin binding protein-like protein [Chloroflexota bacterium]